MSSIMFVYSQDPESSPIALPVLVYIHGATEDSDQEGGDIDIDPFSMIDANLIFITLSYRVGPFGEVT